MIKNKNLKMGLFVFIITLIGLIVYAQFSEDKLSKINHNPEATDLDTTDQLEIAVK